MSVDTVLAAGRTAALKLMRDRCLVERLTGQVLNEDTGVLEDTYTAIYTGVCRLKPRSSSETEWGEHEVTLGQYVAVLPWDAGAGIKREDRLTITDSDDTRMIGRHLEVVAVQLNGTSTARRLLVEDKEG